jgi:hypothetical protein
MSGVAVEAVSLACAKSNIANYVNYIGEDRDMCKPKQPTNASLVSQTNTFLLASAFLLGVAIISRK